MDERRALKEIERGEAAYKKVQERKRRRLELDNVLADLEEADTERERLLDRHERATTAFRKVEMEAEQISERASVVSRFLCSTNYSLGKMVELGMYFEQSGEV